MTYNLSAIAATVNRGHIEIQTERERAGSENIEKAWTEYQKPRQSVKPK